MHPRVSSEVAGCRRWARPVLRAQLASSKATVARLEQTMVSRWRRTEQWRRTWWYVRMSGGDDGRWPARQAPRIPHATDVADTTPTDADPVPPNQIELEMAGSHFDQRPRPVHCVPSHFVSEALSQTATSQWKCRR